MVATALCFGLKSYVSFQLISGWFNTGLLSISFVFSSTSKRPYARKIRRVNWYNMHMPDVVHINKIRWKYVSSHRCLKYAMKSVVLIESHYLVMVIFIILRILNVHIQKIYSRAYAQMYFFTRRHWVLSVPTCLRSDKVV